MLSGVEADWDPPCLEARGPSRRDHNPQCKLMNAPRLDVKGVYSLWWLRDRGIWNLWHRHITVLALDMQCLLKHDGARYIAANPRGREQEFPVPARDRSVMSECAHLDKLSLML